MAEDGNKVGQLRQWLATFGEEHKQHYEQGQIQRQYCSTDTLRPALEDRSVATETSAVKKRLDAAPPKQLITSSQLERLLSEGLQKCKEESFSSDVSPKSVHDFRDGHKALAAGQIPSEELASILERQYTKSMQDEASFGEWPDVATTPKQNDIHLSLTQETSELSSSNGILPVSWDEVEEVPFDICKDDDSKGNEMAHWDASNPRFVNMGEWPKDEGFDNSRKSLAEETDFCFSFEDNRRFSCTASDTGMGRSRDMHKANLFQHTALTSATLDLICGGNDNGRPRDRSLEELLERQEDGTVSSWSEDSGRPSIASEALNSTVGRMLSPRDGKSLNGSSPGSVSSAVQRLGGVGRRKTKVKLQQEALQRQWAATRASKHVKKAVWHVCPVTKVYKKKIILSVDES